MARLFFLLLVLGNLAFFVWAQGYLGNPRGEAGREPERLEAQIQPERLRVTALREEASRVPASVEAASTPAPETQALALAPAVRCQQAGPLPTRDGQQLLRVLGEKGIRAEIAPFEATSYWVHIPPQGAREATDKKVQELRGMGVSDFFVVNDEGESRGAISLGLFHREEAAKEHLQMLVRKGVRSARIGTKPRRVDQVMVNFQGDPEGLERQLAGIAVRAGACPGQ